METKLSASCLSLSLAVQGVSLEERGFISLHSARRELLASPLLIKAQYAATNSVRVSLRLQRNKKSKVSNPAFNHGKISGISLDDIPFVQTLLEVPILKHEVEFQAPDVGEIGA
jgi:hypothetical protein